MGGIQRLAIFVRQPVFGCGIFGYLSYMRSDIRFLLVRHFFIPSAPCRVANERIIWTDNVER